jgi:hypothetical protein
VSKLELDRVESLLRQSANDQAVDLTLVGRNRAVVLSTRSDRPPGSLLQRPKNGIIEQLDDDFYQFFPNNSELVMVRWMNSSFVQKCLWQPVCPGCCW